MVQTRSSQGVSSQKSIKIDSELWDALDIWIETPEAKKLGFHSKADFATQAVRELLEKYIVDKKAFERFLRLYNRHAKRLEYQNVKNPSDFVGYVEKALKFRH